MTFHPSPPVDARTSTSRRNVLRAGTLGLAAALVGCASPAPQAPAPATSPPSPSATASPTPAMAEIGVAAGHPKAAEIGLQVLQDGGTAVDAAIATAFAVSVLEPHASGIGGGGVTLVAEPGQQPTAFDYREMVARNGVIPKSGTGTPGFVDGMWTLHQQYGTMPWERLLAPAADLARSGFEIPSFLSQRMNDGIGSRVVSRYRQFRTADGKRVLREGETLVQKELAATIDTLAADGRDAFYEGSLARKLAKVDGLDAKTLAGYRTERFTPVQGVVGDYTVVSAPPALPGAALIQMLQQAEGAGIADDAPGSAGYVEKLMKAWANANRTVTEQFGDQRFIDVDLDTVLDREANLAIGARLDAQDPSDSPAGPIDPGNTTHLVVVDRTGLAVSMTNTITSFWGGTKSEVVGGFFLNNQLSRFKTVDSPKNQPEPGRKSVTWSNPTMVLDRQGRVVMGIGTPGGQQIPNILSSVLVPSLLQGKPLDAAMSSPRFHLQGGVLAVEGKATAEISKLARRNGWKVRETTRADGIFGSVQSLWVEQPAGRIDGSSDPRRDAGHVTARVA